MSTFYIILSVIQRGYFAQTACVVTTKTDEIYFCLRSVGVKRERGCICSSVRVNDENGFSPETPETLKKSLKSKM